MKTRLFHAITSRKGDLLLLIGFLVLGSSVLIRP